MTSTPDAPRRIPRHLLLLATAAAILFAAAAAGLVLRGRSERAAATPDAARAYVGAVPPRGVRVPAFALREADGRLVTPEMLAGKPLVVMFVDTRCKTSCPIIASRVARGIDQLDPKERAGVAALAISVDPANDTPASVRTGLSHNGAAGRIRFLNGPLHAIRPVWAAFGVLSATDSADADLHTSAVFVYDRDHLWVDTLSPANDLTADNLVRDLRIALDGG